MFDDYTHWVDDTQGTKIVCPKDHSYDYVIRADIELEDYEDIELRAIVAESLHAIVKSM